MNAARVFWFVPHIGWIVLQARAVVASGGKRPIIGVLYPAIFGVVQGDDFFQCV